MRGVQVQVPEQAKAKLDLLTMLRDSALDASRSVQGRLNSLPNDADQRLRDRLTESRDKEILRHNHIHRLLSACNQYLF
jgi:hypothetical protein